jgi:hypothetical protein
MSKKHPGYDYSDRWILLVFLGLAVAGIAWVIPGVGR